MLRLRGGQFDKAEVSNITDWNAIIEHRKRRQKRLDGKDWAEELNLTGVTDQVRPTVATEPKETVIRVQLSSDMQPKQLYKFLYEDRRVLPEDDWLKINRRKLLPLLRSGGMDAVRQEYYKGLLTAGNSRVRKLDEQKVDEAFDVPWLNKDVDRDKLVAFVTGDLELRNAALNVMYDNYRESGGLNSFKDFLNNPVKLYRIGNEDIRTVFMPYSFVPDDEAAEIEIRPIDTFGSVRHGSDAAVMVPYWRVPGGTIERSGHGWEWSDPKKWILTDDPEEPGNGVIDVLDAVIREAEIIKLFSEDNTDVGEKVISRCVDSIQSYIMQLAAAGDSFNVDSAFFAGELNDNLGDYYVQYPEVEAFKERRKQRLDEKGRWVTTENDHKIHLNEEGVPDKGNPHVLAAITSSSKTREEIGRDRVKKVRGRMAKSLEAYKSSGEKVREFAEKYAEANAALKKASRRLESAERYKKTLDSYDIHEGDRDRLQSEVDELAKQKEENPYDRDISGEYNNKSFLLALYDDVYGEETKQYKRDIKRLQAENDSAKRELDRHIADRATARAEIRDHASRKNVQSLKFYSEDERSSIKNDVMGSDAFAGLSEDERSEISKSLDVASDAQLSVLKKTCGKARIMRAEDTVRPSSCYSDGTGIMYLEDADRKDPKVFWHEYGHFMDDFEHSGMEDEVVTHGEGTKYESSSRSFSSVLADEVKLFGKDAADDLQELFDGAAAGKFKVVTAEDEGYISIKSADSGMLAEDDAALAWDMQKAFDQVIDDYLNGGPDGGDAARYQKSIGYPDESERPKREDFMETYVTPKRKLEREREKFKGAEEEYNRLLNDYYRKQDEVRAAHPEYSDTMNRFYEEKRARKKLVAPVTDCLCATMFGQVFSIYGCHEKNYYRSGGHAEKEWAANIHQMMFMGQKEPVELLSKLMPRTMKKVKAAYNEYLWRNLSE